MEKFHTIQPFPEAEHDQLEDDEQEKLAILLNEMKEKFEESTLQHLMLIGRVDISQLSEKRAFYGTQMNLAKARAEWVQGELRKKFSTQIDSDRTILLSAGPRYVGDEATEESRAEDRSVEIWACWIPKKPEQEIASVRSIQ